MRFWYQSLCKIVIATLTIAGSATLVSAKERLVMPFQCGVAGNALQLSPVKESISYAILGPRDQRPFTACVDGKGPDCRTVMVHQFDMSCGGRRVSWVNVAAAMRNLHESAPKLVDGRLNMILMARRRGSEKLPWQNSPDRAYVALPVGYAPVGEIGARFVLPNNGGPVIVTPDSTSVDAYSSDTTETAEGKVYQVANSDGSIPAQSAAQFNSFIEGGLEEDAKLTGRLATSAGDGVQLAAWKTSVNPADGTRVAATGGDSGAFFTYFMIAALLASLVFAGGYGMRRRMLPALAGRGRKLRSGPIGGVGFQGPVPGVATRVSAGHGVGSSAHARGPTHHGSTAPTTPSGYRAAGWTPGQSRTSWSAMLETTLTAAGQTFHALAANGLRVVDHVSAKLSELLDSLSQKRAYRPGRNRSRERAGHSGSNPSDFGSSPKSGQRRPRAYATQETQFQSGLNVVDIGLRYSEEAVSALAPTTQLRDVLTSELKTLRQRQAVLRATITDGSATPSRAEATMRRLTCELERIRRIADSAAETHGSAHDGAAGMQVPQNVAAAYAVLGVNAEVTDMALKKIVDGLRMSWHPDLARDDTDHDVREARTKQLNIAWDLIRQDREVSVQ